MNGIQEGDHELYLDMVILRHFDMEMLEDGDILWVEEYKGLEDWEGHWSGPFQGVYCVDWTSCSLVVRLKEESHCYFRWFPW